MIYHLFCFGNYFKERTYNFRKTNCLRLPKPRLDLMKTSISYQGALHLVTMIEPLVLLF